MPDPTPGELYHVRFYAPEGSWLATFTVELDKIYLPEEVQLQRDVPLPKGKNTLNAGLAELPDGEDARILAAQAATHYAEVTRDPIRQLLRLLMPF